MRFVSISLSNYIGIYNGMRLYDINIDMTKCRNRIVIIRGDNGSGKSTLSKAMSLFPDPNDAFIPGLPARKEIVLADKNTLYKLTFIHGVKQNGERETTKAYITKTFGGNAAELNPNGNVSSYKDILYSELGLDANFAALSQLSNDDRGLADKKPAERKRFVNSIITSLDVYNQIYKTLGKRSSNYRSLINATVGKLNVLGDESVVNANITDVEARINSLQDEKDKAVIDLAREQSTVQMLDPDGSIQDTNTSISLALNADEREHTKLQTIIESITRSNKISSSDIEKDYRIIMDRKHSLIIDNQISRASVDALLAQKEGEAANLAKKVTRLQAISSESSYDDIKNNLATTQMQLSEIETAFVRIGFTVESIPNITREEYILAIETLKDLDNLVSVAFKSEVSFEISQRIISVYINSGNLPNMIDIDDISRRKDIAASHLSEVQIELASISSRTGLLDTLSLRPSDCRNDTCPFIKDALEFSRSNPTARAVELEKDKNDTITLIDSLRHSMEEAEEFNNAINRFRTIIREIDKNRSILLKMPNCEMFSDKLEFFRRLYAGHAFEYISSIYQYIDMANLLDTYKHLRSICSKYESELKVYESKADSLALLQQEIDDINGTINGIAKRIEPIMKEIGNRNIEIASLESLEAAYATIIDTMKKQAPIQQRIQDHRLRLAENSRKMNDINSAIVRMNIAKDRIKATTASLTPLIADRDRLIHNANMIAEYKADLEKLQTEYDLIETIKYYSSPTTGIQLVFMELYMGKIIALANELLRLLFQGQFEIKPFVINETEFRIPCLGGGYLNDDISSMSSSQIGMISMILSFALLHHSSTTYNIIKLDEIDGPLDYTNRVYFMDVLNSIMDIMHTEQCIMISHNSELQVDNSDVILLKHDETNSDYNRGNIIWSYS